MLPFTRDQFMAVFASYNGAVWPVQWIAYLLGAVAVAALVRPGRAASQIIAAVLAVFWLWTGFAYHGLFFAPIDAPAYGFAVLFAVQGLAFAYGGATGEGPRFGFAPGPAAWIGAAFVAYAAIVYPLIGMASTWNHRSLIRVARRSPLFSLPGTGRVAQGRRSRP